MDILRKTTNNIQHIIISTPKINLLFFFQIKFCFLKMRGKEIFINPLYYCEILTIWLDSHL